MGIVPDLKQTYRRLKDVERTSLPEHPGREEREHGLPPRSVE